MPISMNMIKEIYILIHKLKIYYIRFLKENLLKVYGKFLKNKDGNPKDYKVFKFLLLIMNKTGFHKHLLDSNLLYLLYLNLHKTLALGNISDI